MRSSPRPPRHGFFLSAVLFALAVDTGAGTDILLLPSESTYDVGERVEFALVNNSKETITLPSATWWQIRDEEDVVVDGCDMFPQEHEVLPGEFVQASWDQISCADDTPVTQGLYRIDATYESECCPGQTLTVEAFFDIGVVAVTPVSWGRVKSLFEAQSVR